MNVHDHGASARDRAAWHTWIRHEMRRLWMRGEMELDDEALRYLGVAPEAPRGVGAGSQNAKARLGAAPAEDRET